MDLEIKNEIRNLAEQLDAHRKRVHAEHGITLTNLYNVLEKFRAGQPLTTKEQLVYDSGGIPVLKQLHNDLDTAVFAAYGWPSTLTDAEILERLVALNAERAAEEKRGVIHWLRPDYQIPRFHRKRSAPETPISIPVTLKEPAQWPKKMVARISAVKAELSTAVQPLTAAILAETFPGSRRSDITEILETLTILGHVNHAGEKFWMHRHCRAHA